MDKKWTPNQKKDEGQFRENTKGVDHINVMRPKARSLVIGKTLKASNQRVNYRILSMKRSNQQRLIKSRRENVSSVIQETTRLMYGQRNMEVIRHIRMRRKSENVYTVDRTS